MGMWRTNSNPILTGLEKKNKEYTPPHKIKKLEKRKEERATLNMSRTRAAKFKAQEEYTAADRDVKENFKKDKQDSIEELASHVENAVGQGNLKDPNQTTDRQVLADRQTSKRQEQQATDIN
jgi:hypothetical protein